MQDTWIVKDNLRSGMFFFFNLNLKKIFLKIQGFKSKWCISLFYNQGRNRLYFYFNNPHGADHCYLQDTGAKITIQFSVAKK